jgi:outer membrane protein
MDERPGEATASSPHVPRFLLFNRYQLVTRLQMERLEMRVTPSITAVARLAAAAALAAGLSGYDRPLFASEQAPPPPSSPPLQQPLAVPKLPASQPQTGTVLRLSIEEAVTLSLEQNLGIRADRLGPQIEDMSVASARAAFTPQFFSRMNTSGETSPPASFLAGSGDTISEDRFTTTTGMEQQLGWGGANYSVAWDTARVETTRFTSFNPQLSSSISATYTQPLLRNFKIDGFRQQLLLSRTQREIADVQLEQTVTATTRNVRNGYWDLVFALANHKVQVQSLELAQEQLKNNKTRVEVGTLAPIDIVEAEAEVARNEEAVIVAEANIKTAEDVLRALVLSPDRPDFWQLRIEPTEPPELQPRTIDVDAAVAAALANRTDLIETRKQLDQVDINVRYFSNQKMPDLNLQASYNAIGLGGTEFLFGEGGFPPPVIGSSNRPFSSVLADAFGLDFPTWAIGVQIGYPIGTSDAEANLARSRLQKTQGQTNLRNLEMQVITAVRDIGRRVGTNFQRVEATRKAQNFAEQRLSAEQKKFAVGMSDTFRVLQAQRDLAVARNNLLRAVLDYNRTLNDFDAIQKTPLIGR